jgi:hypothetical protein
MGDSMKIQGSEPNTICWGANQIGIAAGILVAKPLESSVVSPTALPRTSYRRPRASSGLLPTQQDGVPNSQLTLSVGTPLCPYRLPTVGS